MIAHADRRSTSLTPRQRAMCDSGTEKQEVGVAETGF
jgi:hypothetical protein